jgi:hypothetical protein
VAANIVQNTAQNCISVGVGGNNVLINGDYNDISAVDQRVSVTVDSKCSTFASQNSTFNADLQNSVEQTLKDQEVALTQWMDASKDTQKTDIANKVTANFTQSTVQTCVNNLTGINNLVVNGSGNVVKDVTQDATLNVISQCILGNQQSSSVVADITNTTNQHGEYTSENPLAFIGDAFKAMAQSAMAIAAVIFIVIICFIFIYMKMSHSGSAPAPVMYQSVLPRTPQGGPQAVRR